MRDADSTILESLYSEKIENTRTKELLNLLHTQYKNRRIILTDDDNIDMTKKFQNENINLNGKPNGVWYALGADWMEWLTYEMPHWLDNYSHAFYLDLDYSQILRINDDKKFEQFEKAYATKKAIFGCVDWEKVAAKFQGVEIIPYLRDFRYGSKNNWYYSWDIASGCIWDMSAVKKVIQIF